MPQSGNVGQDGRARGPSWLKTLGANFLIHEPMPAPKAHVNSALMNIVKCMLQVKKYQSRSIRNRNSLLAGLFYS